MAISINPIFPVIAAQGAATEAVLQPGQYKIPLFAIAFGALFLIVGLFVW